MISFETNNISANFYFSKQWKYLTERNQLGEDTK